MTTSHFFNESGPNHHRLSFEILICLGFPDGSVVKNLPASAGDEGDTGSIPDLGRSAGVGNGLPTPVLLPGKFNGQRSQVGYSPWGLKESDMTDRLTLSLFHTVKDLRLKKSYLYQFTNNTSEGLMPSFKIF